jgi:hypothetical protein
MHTKFWAENLKGRDLLVDFNIDLVIILKWFLRRM